MLKREVPAFRKSELVYAKIRGYPWWPGVIAQVELKGIEDGERKYEWLVNFIGDNSHSRVNEDKLQKFTLKDIDIKLKKNKKLTESIQIANDIFKGKYTYKEWKRKNDMKYKSKRKNAQKRKGLVEQDTDDTFSSSDGNSSDDNIDEEEELILAQALSLSERSCELEPKLSLEKQSSSQDQEIIEDEILPIKKKPKTLNSIRKTIIEDSEEEKSLSSAIQIHFNSDLHKHSNNVSIHKQQSQENNIFDSKPFVTSAINQALQTNPSKSKDQINVIETEDDEEEIKSNLITQQLDLSKDSTGVNNSLQATICQPSIESQSNSNKPPISHISPWKLTFPKSCLKSSDTLASFTRSDPQQEATKNISLTGEPRLLTLAKVPSLSEEKKSRVRFGDEVEHNNNSTEPTNATEESSLKRATRSNQKTKQIKKSPTISSLLKKKNSLLMEQKKARKLTEKKTSSRKVVMKLKNRQPTILMTNQEQHMNEEIILNNNNLETEFIQLIPLISKTTPHTPHFIFESLTFLSSFIKKIQSLKPNTENILEILENNHAKLLMSIMNKSFSSPILPFYQDANASIHQDLFQGVRTELQTLLCSLSTLLFNKFFNHEDSLPYSSIPCYLLNPFNNDSLLTQISSNPSPASPMKKPLNSTNISQFQTTEFPNSDLQAVTSTPTSEILSQIGEDSTQKDLTDLEKILRKKICLKIMKSLREFVKKPKQLQQYAKQIESMVRKADPTMQSEYKQISRNLITFISSQDFQTSTSNIEHYISLENAKDFELLALPPRKNEQTQQEKDNTCLRSPSMQPLLYQTQRAQQDFVIDSFNTNKLSSPSGSTQIEEEDDEDDDDVVDDEIEQTQYTQNQLNSEELKQLNLQTTTKNDQNQSHAKKSVEDEDASTTTFFCSRPIPTAHSSTSSSTLSLQNQQ